MSAAAAELAAAARDVLRGGDHDGPCLNYEGQNPDDYEDWDSCALHVRAGIERTERLRRAVEAYGAERDGAVTTP